MSDPPTPAAPDSPADQRRFRIPGWLQRHRKEAAIVLVMLATIAGPFLLRPSGSTGPARYDRRLVIMTPHHEIIRREFGLAFSQYWKEKTGEVVFVDWRVPGGTSDIAKLLKSEYLGAFQYHWEKKLGQPWTTDVATAALDGKFKLSDTPDSAHSPAEKARRAFLDSDVGIGVDLFFGGGPYDFYQQARNGVLVATAKDGAGGLPAIRKQHPQWFSDTGVPETLSGETFRDKEDRWIGTCLSSFGIVFNRDVLKRLGIEQEPSQWQDLADPRLFGQVALSDPSKSGSVTKAFEMVIQQQMRIAYDEIKAEPQEGRIKKTEAQITEQAVSRGWRRGMQLIQAIAANARYFTDSSTKIPLEVSRGDAAVGMCIDYYGRSAEEQYRQPDGSSRIGFVAPVAGTAISVDPVGMLRGAPEPALATAFMEFVLSDHGQKLWGYKVGSPGGPKTLALRRLPVRKDFYNPQNLPHMADAAEQPFEKAKSFHYEVAWTGPVFDAIRFLIRVMCVDTHDELRHAWQELDLGGFPAHASDTFRELGLVHFDNAAGGITQTITSRDKAQETRLARTLGDGFRKQYRLAASLARRGQ
jgi:iron(III) transport system substrate-binding protein